MGLFGILEKDNINENTFGIVGDSYSDKFRNDRFFVFTAENKKDKENWIKIINETIKKIKKINRELEKIDPIKIHYLNNKDIPNMSFDNNTSLDSIHHPIEAISKGNLKYFIDKGIKFNEDVKYKQYYYKLRDSSRNNFLNEANSLHYAAYLGHIHIVSYFIKN
jgi:hypothetical protein